MFNRSSDPRQTATPGLKPAPYDSPIPSNRAALGATGRAAPPAVAPAPKPAPPAPREVAPAPEKPTAPAPREAGPAVSTPGSEIPTLESGSRLFIGVNIKLKGVEISDCDALVIQGLVDAKVQSKVMQIDKPGTLSGTALIDVAEIHGEFSGELTARTRLVVHGTGRVSGTIRYGKLIVAEGGELNGDVKGIDGSEVQRAVLPTSGSRSTSAPSGEART